MVLGGGSTGDQHLARPFHESVPQAPKSSCYIHRIHTPRKHPASFQHAPCASSYNPAVRPSGFERVLCGAFVTTRLGLKQACARPTPAPVGPGVAHPRKLTISVLRSTTAFSCVLQEPQQLLTVISQYSYSLTYLKHTSIDMLAISCRRIIHYTSPCPTQPSLDSEGHSHQACPTQVLAIPLDETGQPKGQSL